MKNSAAAHTQNIFENLLHFMSFSIFVCICRQTFGRKTFGCCKAKSNERVATTTSTVELQQRGSCLLKTDNERMEMTKNTAETVGS